ncbi:MAG: type VI secretion system tip protein TssI/VgrG, partial [Myxococcota bacterium]
MNSAITKRSPPASKGCARAIVAALRSSDRASELTLRRLIAEATGEQGSGGGYRAHVDCVEAEVPFRPPRPEKRVHNTTETAVVVGPRLVKGHDEDRGKRGAEIHTDEYGRVKVQFHWDREGQWDDRTSCWIRVAQPWAGAGFGFQFFPRVGMEVLVAFMGGDPDRPVVVGSLYNATHPTPELLPDRQTRSGIRTQSTPGGGGFNELSFEDRKGTERVFLHAEKDFEEVVNDTHSLNVKNEQVLVVKHHREVSVGAELVAVENNQSSIVGHNRVSRTGGSVNTVVQVHDTCRVGGDAFATVEGLAVRAHRRDDVTAIDGNTSASVNGDYLMQINGRDELSAAHHVTFVNGSSFTKVRDSLAVKAGDDDDDNERREIRLECGTSSLRLLPDAIEMSADVLALRGTRTVAIEHAIGAIEIGSDGLTICVDRATLQTPDGAALTLTGGR